LKLIADHYGADSQLSQLCEECAELIVAVNHYKRSGDANNLIEEIADVCIMLEQVKYLLDIKDLAIDVVTDSKITRQIARINKGITSADLAFVPINADRKKKYTEGK
jgi:NTP pyrophosphatase (non-canonical NTP hydrolase)